MIVQAITNVILLAKPTVLLQNKRVSFLRQEKDPVQAGLEKFWRNVISPRRKNRWTNPNSFNEQFHILYSLNNVLLFYQEKAFVIN